jgi:diguanylate cyclase (GGDEF)-like protein/PAS domain S-box-containing protein
LSRAAYPRRPPPDESALLHGHPELSILIADDEPRFRSSLKQLMESQGYRVETASSGAEALRCLRERPFQVMLLDLAMPGVTGEQVLEFVTREKLDMAVVIVSGTTSVTQATNVLRKGAFDFLRKPYSVDELIRRVENAYGKVCLERANRSMNERLEESERLHRFMVESSPDLIFMLDTACRFTFLNQRLTGLLGVAPEDLRGQAFAELVHPDDRSRADAFLKRLGCAESRAGRIELRLLAGADDAGVPANGDRSVPVEISATAMPSRRQEAAAEDLAGVYGVARDIRERKQFEDLRQRLGALLDVNVNEIYMLDRQTLRFTYVNQGARENLGYCLEELREMTVWDIQPSHSAEDFGLCIRPLLEGSLDQVILETVHQRSDGSTYPVEMRLQLMTIDGPAQYVAIALDISERRRAQRKLQAQSEFLQTVINGVEDPIMVIDRDYSIRLMNEAARNSLDPRFVSDTEHPKCYELSHHRREPCQGTDHPCPMQQVIATERNATVIHNHPDQSGLPRFVELVVTPLQDLDGSITGVIEAGRDITEHLKTQEALQKKQRLLEHLAQHDALTGLPNRQLARDRLGQCISKAHRTGESAAVLFIDLDRFKQVNDSFGHANGDAVLQLTAKRLRDCVREEDTVARLGGDEFSVIMDSLGKLQHATVMAQKLLHRLQEPIRIAGHELYVTASVGISLYPQDGTDTESLLRNADAAMYKAKDEGRNTFQYYTEDMTEKAFERILMETHLRRALSQREFVLHYQPQINLKTGGVIGLEALVRWQHPDLGLVAPAEFIPLLEETGLILPLSEWVMTQACAQMAAWRREGLNPGRMAINLSGKQLQKQDLPATVGSVLERTGCRPDWVELEVTEGFVMREPAQSIAVLESLRGLGIALAIDDFGTGYSSLTYLKRLPIAKLKIDQSFVRHLPHDADDAAISRAVIALGNSLNLQVIAEGVETAEQRQFLNSVGCHEAQGNFFGPPASAREVTAFLRGSAGPRLCDPSRSPDPD